MEGWGVKNKNKNHITLGSIVDLPIHSSAETLVGMLLEHPCVCVCVSFVFFPTTQRTFDKAQPFAKRVPRGGFVRPTTGFTGRRLSWP